MNFARFFEHRRIVVGTNSCICFCQQFCPNLNEISEISGSSYTLDSKNPIFLVDLNIFTLTEVSPGSVAPAEKSARQSISLLADLSISSRTRQEYLAVMEQYQDEWAKGTLSSGVRECESRYEIIKEYASRFNRPFTVLDIGANLGYFGFRLMEDFDCVSVMVEAMPNYHRSLKNLARENDAGVVLFHRFDHSSLKTLGDVEHFDLVLALSVVHHIEGDVNQTCSLIEQLGDHVIWEIADEEGACGQDKVNNIIIDSRWEKIGEGKSHLAGSHRNIYASHHPKTTLAKRYLGCDLPSTIQIESTDDSKRVSFSDKEENRDWISGINLQTFHSFRGSYPDRTQISEGLLAVDTNNNHGDIRPWNFVIGKGIHPIDAQDPRHTEITDDAESIRAVIDWLASMDAKFPSHGW